MISIVKALKASIILVSLFICNVDMMYFTLKYHGGFLSTENFRKESQNARDYQERWCGRGEIAVSRIRQTSAETPKRTKMTHLGPSPLQSQSLQCPDFLSVQVEKQKTREATGA